MQSEELQTYEFSCRMFVPEGEDPRRHAARVLLPEVASAVVGPEIEPADTVLLDGWTLVPVAERA